MLSRIKKIGSFQDISENKEEHTSHSGESTKLNICIRNRIRMHCYNFIKGGSVVPFHVFKYFVHFVKVSNDRNHFHLMTTFWAGQWIDLICGRKIDLVE